MSEESKTYVIPTIEETLIDCEKDYHDRNHIDPELAVPAIKELIKMHLKAFADMIHQKESVFLSMEGSYYEPSPEEILAIYPIEEIK